MSSKVKVKVRYTEVGQILKSADMQAVLAQQAGQVASSLGSGYEVQAPYVGKSRASVGIRAVSKEAIREVYQNNALLHAIGR